MRRLMFLACGIGLLAACAPKKLMLNETFVPHLDKTARSSIKTSGSVGSGDNQTVLNDFFIQVCDVSNGIASNCKTNLILENVTDYQVQTGWSVR